MTDSAFSHICCAGLCRCARGSRAGPCACERRTRWKRHSGRSWSTPTWSVCWPWSHSAPLGCSAAFTALGTESVRALDAEALRLQVGRAAEQGADRDHLEELKPLCCAHAS